MATKENLWPHHIGEYRRNGHFSQMEMTGTRRGSAGYLRVSMKTAFSPNRLCTVSGIQVPSFWPEMLKATARSTRAFKTSHRLAKSLIVQRCALGLTYQASGKFSVTGMRPVNSSRA